MTQVHFYTLDQIGDENSSLFVCELTYQLMRQQQRILIWCENQMKAEALDELLWQQPAHAFIPHNLLGEGPHQGTPVLLAWPKSLPQQEQQAEQEPRIQPNNDFQALGRHTVVINLSQAAIEPAHTFAQVIELAPVEPKARAESRERYKYYRQFGFNLTNQQAQLTLHQGNNEGNHG